MREFYGFPVLTGSVPDLAEMDPGAFSEILKQVGPWLMTLGKNILVALILFLVGKKLIQIVRRMLDHSLERAGMEIGAAKFLKAVVNVCLYALLLFMIAGQIGINTASIIAVLGTASLALSLALQGSLANFAGGVLILVMHPFRVGDYIICAQGEGTVNSIGLVYTTLTTIDNKAITIPNGTLSNTTVTNVTAMGERRVDLTVGIGYQADIRKAKELLTELYQNHPSVLKEKGITVYVDNLGDSAVVLGARGWVKSEDYWQTRWDLTESIKLTFDEAGIEIPFNQLDVHVIQ